MGRTHAWLLGTAAAALIASAGSAQAYTINDNTLVWGYNAGTDAPENAGSTWGKWRDVIANDVNAIPGFQTFGVNVSYGASSVVLDIYTNFRLGVHPEGASAGDIWLDLDQNAGTGTQGFESAIVLERPYSPGGVPTPAVGFYNGSGANAEVTWKTVNQVWGSGYIVGGKYCNTPDCTAGATSPLPGNKPDTLSVITGGGTTTGTVAATNFASGIEITLSGLSDAELALFEDGFTFGWGTGTCGNDTIVGTVPAVPVPAALPLMLTALGGLTLIARRRNAETA